MQADEGMCMFCRIRTEALASSAIKPINQTGHYECERNMVLQMENFVKTIILNKMEKKLEINDEHYCPEKKM